MSYESILVQIEESIATITLNRPNALNAINRSTMQELNDWFSKNKSDFNIRGVVITGSGEKAFAAGADIKEFEKLTQAETEEMSSFGHNTYLLIEHFHAPVLAVINGYALGGGCELAMACHMRIAEEHSKFGQPEANLGLSPGYGGTQRLTKLVGMAKSFELLFTCDLISAKEAEKIGLVNRVVEKGTGMEVAQELMKKIKTKAPLAAAQNIKLVNAYQSENGYAKEASAFAELMVTADAKEGASAFVEKRKANFIGK